MGPYKPLGLLPQFAYLKNADNMYCRVKIPKT